MGHVWEPETFEWYLRDRVPRELYPIQRKLPDGYIVRPVLGEHQKGCRMCRKKDWVVGEDYYISAPMDPYGTDKVCLQCLDKWLAKRQEDEAMVKKALLLVGTPSPEEPMPYQTRGTESDDDDDNLNQHNREVGGHRGTPIKQEANQPAVIGYLQPVTPLARGKRAAQKRELSPDELLQLSLQQALEELAQEAPASARLIRKLFSNPQRADRRLRQLVGRSNGSNSSSREPSHWRRVGEPRIKLEDGGTMQVAPSDAVSVCKKLRYD